jgi:hypothetical protein
MDAFMTNNKRLSAEERMTCVYLRLTSWQGHDCGEPGIEGACGNDISHGEDMLGLLKICVVHFFLGLGIA